MSLVIALVFITGTALASFLNAQIYRLEEKELSLREFFFSRSICEECAKELDSWELFPILSYLYHRGRCKRCGYKVPIIYPMSEFLLGLSFVFVYVSAIHPVYYFIFTTLFFLSMYDLQYMGFPKFIMNTFLITAVVYAVGGSVFELVEFDYVKLMISVGIAVGVLVLNYFKESFGIGDVLVFIFLSLLVPLDEFLYIVIGSVIVGAVVAIFLLLLGKVERKSHLPFVPFIYMSTLLYPTTELIFQNML